MKARSPIVSEFETPEQAEAYERWLQEKVAKALADPRPPVPHDEVVTEIRAIIAKAKRRKAC
ncbi:MAG TPA: stability determinant [Allosphingosinicella sp.]|nr:stability determinant [Allosphingosinicella sp.]